MICGRQDSQPSLLTLLIRLPIGAGYHVEVEMLNCWGSLLTWHQHWHLNWDWYMNGHRQVYWHWHLHPERDMYWHLYHPFYIPVHKNSR